MRDLPPFPPCLTRAELDDALRELELVSSDESFGAGYDTATLEAYVFYSEKIVERAADADRDYLSARLQAITQRSGSLGPFLTSPAQLLELKRLIKARQRHVHKPLDPH